MKTKINWYYVKRFVSMAIPTTLAVLVGWQGGLPLWATGLIIPVLQTLDKFLRDADWYNTHSVLFKK